MSSLLTPELLRRLEQFQLLAARRAKSSAKGERRSRARGQSAVEGALRSVRGRKSSMTFFQNISVLNAAGGADLNESLRRGAIEARAAGLAIVLSDFLDPAGYESGLTALVGRGFQVNVVQILA